MSVIELVKRNGNKESLKLHKVEEFIKRRASDLGCVDVPRLLDGVQESLYSGITTADLHDLLILNTTALIELDPDYDTLAGRLLLDKILKEVRGKSVKDSAKDEEYRQAFIDGLNKGVSSGILNPLILEFDLDRLKEAIVPDRDNLLRYMGIQTLYEKYLLKVNDRRLETVQAFWMRVAMGLSLLEEEKTNRAIEFYEAMSLLKAIPSTPTLFHSGYNYSMLSSCFLNYCSDDLHHIFKVFGDNAQLSKFSGGIGTDFTSVRGTGAKIKSINIESQGLIPFLKIQNDTTIAISRSGKRRGAAAVYCELFHYDIEDFIDLKRNTGDDRRRTHDLNTALWIPDLFMQRVEEDGDWTLFSPDEVPDLHEIYGKEFKIAYERYEKEITKGNIKLYKRLKAKNLWKKMITSLFETGHPWLTWKDPSNIRNPQDHCGVIHASNLCTEVLINTGVTETGTCNLLSQNLSSFVQDGKIQWDELAKTTQTSIRMLDNTIDNGFYPTKEAEHANKKHRPLGLGQMGWQDMLFKLNIDFDSQEAEELADRLNEFISYHAIFASNQLALERGSYSSFDGSKWSRGIFPVDTLSILESDREDRIDVNREQKMDWNELKELVRNHGMRNSLIQAIAPNATISNISGCFPCIEAPYSNMYTKSNVNGEFTIINRYLTQDLKDEGLWNEEMVNQIKLHNGSVQKITGIPRRLKHKYKTAFEVDLKACIRQTAVRGKWIDQSQSHNVFFDGKSGKILSDLYMYGWKRGLKTTYYLRTFGATHIEKATTTMNSPSKECRIDDPECTSCQ